MINGAGDIYPKTYSNTRAAVGMNYTFSLVHVTFISIIFSCTLEMIHPDSGPVCSPRLARYGGGHGQSLWLPQDLRHQPHRSKYCKEILFTLFSTFQELDVNIWRCSLTLQSMTTGQGETIPEEEVQELQKKLWRLIQP